MSPARLRLIFSYTILVQQYRICSVSFTDPLGVTHSVEVSASTLYEAAVLAVVAFRRAGLHDVTVGNGILCHEDGNSWFPPYVG